MGVWFSSWYVIFIDTGHIAQSPVWPKVESCFQDGTCSVSSFNTLTWIFLKFSNTTFKSRLGKAVRKISKCNLAKMKYHIKAERQKKKKRKSV